MRLRRMMIDQPDYAFQARREWQDRQIIKEFTRINLAFGLKNKNDILYRSGENKE